LKDETFDSTASAAGPVLAARVELGRSGNVAASVEGSAGVLLYDRDFPAGASRYEFMFRIGPTLSYRLNEMQDLSLMFMRMHVSNAKGSTTNNPASSAGGFAVKFSGVF